MGMDVPGAIPPSICWPVLFDRFGDRLRYVLVLNQLRGDDFSQLEASGQLRARWL